MQQYCKLKGKPRTHEPIFNVRTAVESQQLQVRRTDLYWAQYISSIAKKAHQCFYLHLGLRGFNISLNIKVAQVYSGEHTDWVQHGLVRLAAENGELCQVHHGYREGTYRKLCLKKAANIVKYSHLRLSSHCCHLEEGIGA